jgi:O-glycosyl hydrolase
MVELPLAMTIAVCCGMLAMVALVGRALETGRELVRVDPHQRQQTLEGWGTSLCWWANAVGGWEGQSTRTRLMELVFDPAQGLGLNIVRYNIGGGENPRHDFMSSWRAVPGFKADPEGPYQWGADSGQRWVLLESIRRGVTITEAFSNSPPWWMTVSGSVTGNSEQRPAENNLCEDMYDVFADYLTEVVRNYRDRYGVTFDTLTPLNEPTAAWWTFGNNQEGCHFTSDTQGIILMKTAQQLARKILATGLSAPEEYSIDETVETWQSYEPATREVVSQINTHTYAGDCRADLMRLARAANKRLYVSEYGNGIDGEFGSALELARVISLDLNELQCDGWVYWQAIGNLDTPDDWHAIHVSYSRRAEITIKKQYWALLQFARYVRPGSVILSVSAQDVVAALSPEGRLVLVVSNRQSADRPVAFDLSAFSGLGEWAEWTRTTEEENHKSQGRVPLRGGILAVDLVPRSVNTFLVDVRSKADL